MQLNHPFLQTKDKGFAHFLFIVYFFSRFCGHQFSVSPNTYKSKSNLAFIVFKSFDEEFPSDSTANLGFRLHFQASEYFDRLLSLILNTLWLLPLLINPHVILVYSFLTKSQCAQICFWLTRLQPEFRMKPEYDTFECIDSTK